MKKIFYLAVICLLFGMPVNAQSPILLNSERIDPTPIGGQPQKSPIDVPSVSIEDYTLYFTPDHPEFILYIKDEEDNTVYSTTVYSSVTTIVLPSYLSGNYQIQLVWNGWMFYGWFNL